MNDDFNRIKPEETEGIKKTEKNSLAGTAALTVLLSLLTVLPSLNIFSTATELVAIALFANMTAVRRTPAAAYISTVISAVASILITKSVFAGLVPVLAVCVVGTAAALCIKKKAGLVVSSAIIAATFIFMTAVPFAIGVYMVYGSVIGGIRTYFSQIFDEAASIMKNSFDAAGVPVQYETVRAMFSEAAMLLPGMIVAVAEVFGGLIYIGSYLISRFRRIDVREFYPKGLEVVLGTEPAVFFIVTTVFTLIVSNFKSANVLFYALMNLLIILILPMIVYGVYIMIKKLVTPRPVIKMENGMEYRPAGFSFLWIVVPLLILNFPMALLITAFYGAFQAISKNKKNRDEKENKQ